MHPLPQDARGVIPAPIAYRPEIDGLRAVAVVAVVIHHAAPGLLKGGFAGVDVFFVISGYLIAAILARELATGQMRLLAFWERRLRRIVPALAAMLIGTLVLAWALIIPEDFYQFAKSLAASALFGSNLLYAYEVDYFATSPGYGALVHTWTLGVEEQFYILFPLLLMAVWRWRPRAALPLTIGLALASFAFALVMIGRWPLAAFYLLPSRMWELLLGAACALLPRVPRANGWLALAGLGMIAAGFLRIHQWAGVPGPLFLLPTIGTAFALLFAREGTLAARILAWRPAVLIGLVSFGLYLWHQPALFFANYLWIGEAPVAAKVAAVAAALALAAGSYRWLERPVRERRLLASPRRLLLVCAAALCLPLAAGVAGYARLLLPASGADAARLGGLKPDRFTEPVIIPPQGPIDFVLYGDSHAIQYLEAFNERLGTGALVSQFGCLSAGGLTNKDPAWKDFAICADLPGKLDAVVRERGVRTVFWAQRWEREIYDNASGQQIGLTTEEAGSRLLLAAMKRLHAGLPPGTRIVIIGNSPTAWAAGERFSEGWMRCQSLPDTDCPDSYPAALAEGIATNARLKAFAAGNPGFSYIEPRDALCSKGRCWIVQGGILNYWDGSHMTRSAARRVAATIDPALLAAEPAPPATLP